MDRDARDRGYLLLEVLAACVLVALVAALLVPGMRGGGRDLGGERDVRAVVDLDQRARSLALSSGPVVCRVSRDGHEVRVVSDVSGVVLVRRFSGIVSLAEEEAGEPLTQVWYDALGRAEASHWVVREDDRVLRIEIDPFSGVLRGVSIGGVR